MNNLLDTSKSEKSTTEEIVTTEVATEEIAVKEKAETTTYSTVLSSTRMKKTPSPIIVILICLIGFAAIYYFLWTDMIDKGVEAATNSYAESKEEAHLSTYNKFFESSKDAHAVSNDVAITIDSIREENELEVLQVHDVVYETSENEEGNLFEEFFNSIVNPQVTSWLEIPGEGVFTVDLKTAEFIIDEAHNHVLIRIFPPQLSQFRLSYDKVVILYFNDEGLLNETAKVGEAVAREQLSSAESSLIQNIRNNQRFDQSAKDSAVQILTILVKDLNPELPDLTVEVEFID